MRWNEAVDALLKLVENEPVANHCKQVPEVQGAKEVENVDDCSDYALSALVVLIHRD